MPIEIKIVGENAGQALAELRDLSTGLTGGVSAAAIATAPAISNVVNATAGAAATVPPVRRPRAGKTAEPETVQEEKLAEAVAPEPEAAAVAQAETVDPSASNGDAPAGDAPVSLDELKQLMSKVLEKHSGKFAQELMREKFGPEKQGVSRLDPSEYAAAAELLKGALK